MQSRTLAVLRLAVGLVAAAAFTAYATVAVLTAVASGRLGRGEGHIVSAAAAPQAFWTHVGLLTLGGALSGALGAACLLALGRHRSPGAQPVSPPVAERDAA